MCSVQKTVIREGGRYYVCGGDVETKSSGGEGSLLLRGDFGCSVCYFLDRDFTHTRRHAYAHLTLGEPCTLARSLGA
jgi:hypothetical protein